MILCLMKYSKKLPLQLIKQIFGDINNSNGVKIIMNNLQRLHGHAYCGISAIAVLSSGLQGKSKHFIDDKKKLWEHLTQCFAAKLIALFARLM